MYELNLSTMSRLVVLASLLCGLLRHEVPLASAYLLGDSDTAFCWDDDVLVTCHANWDAQWIVKPEQEASTEEALGFEVRLVYPVAWHVDLWGPMGNGYLYNHVNAHACTTASGTCTPLVAATPGLVTHTAARKINETVAGQEQGVVEIEQDITLGAGTWTVILHARVYECVDEECSASIKHDIALGQPNVQVTEAASSPSDKPSPAPAPKKKDKKEDSTVLYVFVAVLATLIVAVSVVICCFWTRLVKPSSPVKPTATAISRSGQSLEMSPSLIRMMTGLSILNTQQKPGEEPQEGGPLAADVDADPAPPRGDQEKRIADSEAVGAGGSPEEAAALAPARPAGALHLGAAALAPDDLKLQVQGEGGPPPPEKEAPAAVEVAGLEDKLERAPSHITRSVSDRRVTDSAQSDHLTQEPGGAAGEPPAGDAAGEEEAGSASSTGVGEEEEEHPARTSVERSPSQRPASRSLSQGYIDIPFGDLELEEMPLGSGSFGQVFRATWRSLNVAVKILNNVGTVDSAVLDAFTSEVEMLASLRCPNVVMLLGACTNPAKLCMVMEYCAKGSLFEILRRHKPVPPQQGGPKVPPALPWLRRLQISVDVCMGMSFLHLSDPVIVHRDLKSPNIMIDSNWQAKVGDLGLSRMLEGSKVQGTQSVNSPRWLAPEVLQGDIYDTKSDVYSFGVILWELCTGAIPWEEEMAANSSPYVLINLVVFQGQRLQVPGHVYPEYPELARLQGILEACWRPPAERPSFSELVKTLKPLFDDELKRERSKNRPPARPQ